MWIKSTKSLWRYDASVARPKRRSSHSRTCSKMFRQNLRSTRKRAGNADPANDERQGAGHHTSQHPVSSRIDAQAAKQTASSGRWMKPSGAQQRL